LLLLFWVHRSWGTTTDLVYDYDATCCILLETNKLLEKKIKNKKQQNNKTQKYKPKKNRKDQIAPERFVFVSFLFLFCFFVFIFLVRLRNPKSAFFLGKNRTTNKKKQHRNKLRQGALHIRVLFLFGKHSVAISFLLIIF